MLDACIELDNAIIDGHAGMISGVHICRGNTRACSTRRAVTIASRSEAVPAEWVDDTTFSTQIGIKLRF
jgi:hypothetical protein